MNRDSDFIDLKSLALELDVPQATLSGLLPDSVRALMDKDGEGNRVRYHRKYIPAIEAMLDEVDANNKRVVKPKTAHLFLAPRIEAINRGEALGSVRESQIANRESQSVIQASGDPAERALAALEKLAAVGIVSAPPDKLLTREEAMEEFGLASSTLQKIAHSRDGRAMKWKRSVVAAYVASWG